MSDEFTLPPPKAQSNGTGVTYESVQNGFNYITKSFLVFLNTLATQPQTPTGPAGGDLSGTYPNPTVTGVNGSPAGTMANQNASAVAITGGTISGVTLSTASAIGVASGGTGRTSLTANSVLLGEGTSAVNFAATSATAGVPLVSNGAGVDPSFGTASIAGGGTGATTASAARTNLGLGSIATQNSNNVAVTGGTIDNTPIGQTTPAAGSFTTFKATLSQFNVLLGGGASALLGTAAPSATSGVPLVSQGAAANPAFGTTVVAGGGTGLTTLTANAVMLGNGTGNVAFAAPVSAGYVLTDNGPGSNPTFQPGNSGRLIGVQRFTTSGTYNPTAGTNSVIVEVVGGGGGSGGCGATAAGQSAVGGSGSAGSYAKARYTSGFSGVTITVGAAGAAGAAGANAGGAGGTSSFGTLISCPGGNGGAGGVAISGNGIIGSTQSPAAPTITGASVILASIPGQGGMWGLIFAAGTTQGSGNGGSSPLGMGGFGVPYSGASSPFLGIAGTGNGAGASGTALGASLSAQAGAAGSQGAIIVYEYN